MLCYWSDGASDRWSRGMCSIWKNINIGDWDWQRVEAAPWPGVAAPSSSSPPRWVGAFGRPCGAVGAKRMGGGSRTDSRSLSWSVIAAITRLPFSLSVCRTLCCWDLAGLLCLSGSSIFFLARSSLLVSFSFSPDPDPGCTCLPADFGPHSDR